jgi:hypothetical protein
MDNRIRRNEICIVGLPRCDFVFSSTRTCFIAYGFENSPLEVSILRRLLENRGILAEEAGGALAPGQNAFCAKICSKIITAQFCIVLINNEEVNGREIPSANVNMEYGLMLGFNKYVIPFQRARQNLPFNVAGLDTIKYGDRDFERLATQAIDQAVAATQQNAPPLFSPDQVIEVFLLIKEALVTPLNTEGDRNLFQMGMPLGFRLLNDFSGLNYMYFGNFTALRPEVALWYLQMLRKILDGRRASFRTRVDIGFVTPDQVQTLDNFLNRLQIWAVLSSDDDKVAVQTEIEKAPLGYKTQIFSMADIQAELAKLARPGA